MLYFGIIRKIRLTSESDSGIAPLNMKGIRIDSDMSKIKSTENQIPNKRINIRGIPFDSVSYNEAVEKCMDFVRHPKGGGSAAILHTPNSEIVQLCIDQNKYYEIIGGADIIIPDGVGIILASKILGTPLTKGKVAGVEVADGILKEAAREGYSVFFYGGKPKNEESDAIADIAASKAAEKYPGLKIAGTCDGYIKDDAAVISRIHGSGADILYVCLGAPKQEVFMFEHKNELGVKLCCGFGGTLDVMAGTVKRAPKIFIKLGLEWFYRLITQPSRFFRMLALPRFLIGTIFSKKISDK